MAKNRKARKVGIGKQALLHIFNSKYRSIVEPLTFNVQELNAALKTLGLEIQNKGDIVYYAGKRGGLPQEILDAGFNNIIIKKEGNESIYTFTYVENNNIIFPECAVVNVPNRIEQSLYSVIAPNGISDVDEQTFLSIINKHKILDHFLGLNINHYVFHRRCTIPNIGQVEIDELAFAPSLGKAVIIPVEAKGKKEELTKAQIKNGVYYADYKLPGLTIRPVAMKLFANEEIGVVETDLEAEPIRFARYKII